MKINLKKIGAIVAGATILASTAAFAGLWFGDTMLVDDNGAPTTKVVIPEMGAMSDGVAGSIVAGKIVGESYKTEELSASVVGTATCSGEDDTEGGTCAVTNEKVQLEIHVPGGVAEGVYTVNNLIGDYLNRRLGDRIDNAAGDTATEYPIGGSDISDNANPFTDAASGNIGPSETFMFRIDGGMFSPFATQSITDDTAAKTYSEQQDMWIEGSSYYSDSDNDVVGDLSFLAYTLKFKGSSDDFGIPVCTTPDGTDYTYCKSGALDANFDYATETHKVRVGFLGEPWIISEMDPPTWMALPAQSESQVYAGGSVKLAKESVSGIINQGESLPVDDLKFHLDDLEAHGNVVSAIVSVLDANDNILKKDRVVPGTTQEFNIGGKIYRFHVYKVAPGYTFGAKWADVAIFAKELKIEDGQHLDPDYDTNEEYQAAVGWKNKGAQVGVDEQLDHLRTIVLYSDDISALSSSGEDRLEENDYLPIVQDPVAWKLTYAGLSITSSDRDSLKYRLERTGDQTISSTKGPWESTGSDRVACTIFAPYVRVQSSKSGNVFEITDTGGMNANDGTGGTTLSDKEFFIATALHPVCDNTIGDTGTCAFHGFNYGMAGFYCDSAALNCPDGMELTDLDLDDDGVYDVTDVCVAVDASAACWTGAGFDCPAGAGTIFMRLSSTNQHYGYEIYPWTWAFDAAPPWPTNSLWVNYETVGDGDTDWDTGGLFEVAFYENAVNIAESFMGDDYGLGTVGPFADSCFDPAVGSPACFGQDGGGAPRLAAAGPIIPDWYLAFSEKAGEDTSNEFADYALNGLYVGEGWSGGDPGDATFNWDTQNGAGEYVTREDYTLYMYAGPVEPRGRVSTLEEGGVTERGSVFSSIDDTSVTYYMANQLAYSQFVLASAEGTSSATGTCIRTIGEGETTEPCNGVTVTALEITEDVGPCSAAGGSAACVASMEGVSAVILPDNTATVSQVVPYANAYSGLVILDRDAVGVNTLVAIGGDKVNTVTAQLLEGAAVDWTTETVVVREVVKGSKIVVAGAEAADTLTAANQFVSEVRRA